MADETPIVEQPPILSEPPPPEPVSQPRVVTATANDAIMLRVAVDAAILEIETVTAAQWGREQFNEGARAAADVLKRHLAAL